MIFDKVEIERLITPLVTGRIDALQNSIINDLALLEKKIDTNYKMQQEAIRDLERRFTDAVR